MIKLVAAWPLIWKPFHSLDVKSSFHEWTSLSTSMRHFSLEKSGLAVQLWQAAPHSLAAASNYTGVNGPSMKCHIRLWLGLWLKLWTHHHTTKQNIKDAGWWFKDEIVDFGHSSGEQFTSKPANPSSRWIEWFKCPELNFTNRHLIWKSALHKNLLF